MKEPLLCVMCGTTLPDPDPCFAGECSVECDLCGFDNLVLAGKIVDAFPKGAGDE